MLLRLCEILVREYPKSSLYICTRERRACFAWLLGSGDCGLTFGHSAVEGDVTDPVRRLGSREATRVPAGHRLGEFALDEAKRAGLEHTYIITASIQIYVLWYNVDMRQPGYPRVRPTHAPTRAPHARMLSLTHAQYTHAR